MKTLRARTLLLTTTLLAGLAPAATAEAGSSARRTVIRASVLPSLAQATGLGAAPSGEHMSVGFLLAHPNPAGEDALVAQLYDRSSPSYHAFLTPASYNARFGEPAATRAATKHWLTGGGLTVQSVSATGDYWLVDGTVAQLQTLLQTSIKRYRQGSTSFLANTTLPSTPAAVPVLDIMGLNTKERYHTLAGPAMNPDIGTRTPADLRSIYQQPADRTGTGVSVAILGSGATDQVIKDLHQFDDEQHMPQVPVDVKHFPATGDFSDDSGNEEWNIDMQAIHGMAPGISKEVMYFSPTLQDSQLTAALTGWVNDPDGPPIMNASLGECEEVPIVNPILNNAALAPINGNDGSGALPVSQGLSQNSEPATSMELQQAVMEGRNFFSSSGDNGSSCTVVYPGANGVANEAVPLTSDPASSPYANAVGGTVLYSDGGTPAQRSLEMAWTFSGGNSSPFIPAPAFQQNVPNLNRPCVVDRTGAPTNTGQLCRGVPDVAALSGDVISNGYSIVADGKDSQGGGTSLSSPLWAGMWARIAGTAPAGTTGYGFADQAFYAIAKDPTRYANSFFDITTGSNGANPALPGYDYVTGLGAPKVTGLMADVPAVAPAVVQPGGTGVGPGTPATGAGTATPGASCKDTIAPVTTLKATGIRFTTKGLTVRGTTTDRGCGAKGAGAIGRVGVAVGRERPGHAGQCLFLRANGSFARPAPCARRIFLPATGTASWRLLVRRSLPKGRYDITARAIDKAGNAERRRLSGKNLRRASRR